MAEPPSPESSNAYTDDNSMSPTTRVVNWLGVVATPSPTPSPSLQPDKKRKQRLNNDDGGSTSTTSKRQKTRPSNSELTEDTHLRAESASVSPPPVILDKDGRTNSWPHAADVENHAIVVDPIAHTKPTPRVLHARRCRREAVAASLRDRGWPEADVALYRKIDMRGREPLLPGSWEKDFPGFPRVLFNFNPDRTFIKSVGSTNKKGADFRAIKALEELVDLGTRVRDKIKCEKAPEGIIKRAISDYFKWSMKDLGIWTKKDWTPILAIEVGLPEADTELLQSNITSKLKKLHASWQDALAGLDRNDETPPIYGVVVTRSVVAVVSYVVAVPDNAGSAADDLRIIKVVDFGKADYDVWNSFVLAILAVHCRNIINKMAEDKKLRHRMESMESIEPEADLDV